MGSITVSSPEEETGLGCFSGPVTGFSENKWPYLLLNVSIVSSESVTPQSSDMSPVWGGFRPSASVSMSVVGLSS